MFNKTYQFNSTHIQEIWQICVQKIYYYMQWISVQTKFHFQNISEELLFNIRQILVAHTWSLRDAWDLNFICLNPQTSTEFIYRSVLLVAVNSWSDTLELPIHGCYSPADCALYEFLFHACVCVYAAFGFVYYFKYIMCCVHSLPVHPTNKVLFYQSWFIPLTQKCVHFPKIFILQPFLFVRQFP